MPRIQETARFTQDNHRKLQQLVEIRNLDAKKRGQTEMSRNAIINEAVSFYHAYITGISLDGEVNAIYKAELNNAFRSFLKPIYSMMNGISFQNRIITDILKALYSEMNTWADEDTLKNNFSSLFPIDEVMVDIERSKNK